MEQVLLAPKTGQSKAILSRRFALFISFNWTLQLQWDQEFITIWNTKMKICLSYRLLKKNWAVEILSPGTDLKTLHFHRILHDQEHPTSPTHIHWRHRTVPRSDSAGGRSRPRQVGAECFHLLVSVLVVGSTPPILGEESTALVKCWSPLSKPLMLKLSPKLPSPPDRILLFLMVIFRYREGGPASYWIHHWVNFLTSLSL